jgi:hypothetical protein
MRKIPLDRYDLRHLTRAKLERGAWLGTPSDYRSTIEGVPHVMYDRGLAAVSDLPEEELLSRYVSNSRRVLQRQARAGDLGLFELNPDDPEKSILFADSEVLAKMRGRWELMYVQPANFDEAELTKASKYAQVVAALYPDLDSESLLAIIRQPSSHTDWQKLEKSGSVLRDSDGNVTIAGAPVASPSLHDTRRQPGDTRDRRAHDYACLSTAENDILQHYSRWGSAGYPIQKLSTGRWTWSASHGVGGSPELYRTRAAGHRAFERYIQTLLDRVAESARNQ